MTTSTSMDKLKNVLSDSFSIHGVPENDNKDTAAVAVDIMNEAVKSEDTKESPVKTFTRADVSVAHRLPSRVGSRPIIVRFIRREDKTILMKNKWFTETRTKDIHYRRLHVNSEQDFIGPEK